MALKQQKVSNIGTEKLGIFAAGLAPTGATAKYDDAQLKGQAKAYEDLDQLKKKAESKKKKKKKSAKKK